MKMAFVWKVHSLYRILTPSQDNIKIVFKHSYLVFILVTMQHHMTMDFFISKINFLSLLNLLHSFGLVLFFLSNSIILRCSIVILLCWLSWSFMEKFVVHLYFQIISFFCYIFVKSLFISPFTSSWNIFYSTHCLNIDIEHNNNLLLIQ